MGESSSHESFRTTLLDRRILTATDVPGLYQRSEGFEAVVRGLSGALAATVPEGPVETRYLAPVMPRDVLEDSDYVTSFPNLMGVVSSFLGGEGDLSELRRRVGSGEDWGALVDPTEVALCSAACHQLYPTLAGSTVPDEGFDLQVEAYCFRHEPSEDPARMQSFRMREVVRLGSPERALAHRDQGVERVRAVLAELGLEADVVEANDPFFGRGGRMLAADQRERALKFELVAPISSAAPGAVASANYHEDHFGRRFEIRRADGSPAHSACVGVGLERVALALYWAHGLEPLDWPRSVRSRLGLA